MTGGNTGVTAGGTVTRGRRTAVAVMLCALIGALPAAATEHTPGHGAGHGIDPDAGQPAGHGAGHGIDPDAGQPAGHGAGHGTDPDAGQPAGHGAGHAASDWDRDSALAYSQAAIGREVRDATFHDHDGRAVRLADYRGRPLVVSMIYTSCNHVCPLLTSSLARASAVAREALGTDSFAIVTVGFDTANDTPVRMRSFAASRGIDIRQWAFLSADAATVDALAADLGFIYYPAAQGFDHLAQTTLIDADGRVYRQVYGDALEPPALVEPLKELVLGQPGSAPGLDGWLRGIRLFCTIYDPASGRYRFDYSVAAMALAGALSLGATLVVIVRAWRGSERRVARTG
ncbi:MAG: SCO family protein [Gammaproteobacteria bacterium]|nr:SCO family protein [Gammaproteobacteria bacterium]